MLTTNLKKLKPWVGETEHLCRPDLAMGCQFVTFDLEPGPCGSMGYLGVPSQPWVADRHDFVLTRPPSNNASTLCLGHHILLHSCLLTLSNFGTPRCLIFCQSTGCLFYCHINLGFVSTWAAWLRWGHEC